MDLAKSRVHTRGRYYISSKQNCKKQCIKVITKTRTGFKVKRHAILLTDLLSYMYNMCPGILEVQHLLEEPLQLIIYSAHQPKNFFINRETRNSIRGSSLVFLNVCGSCH
jgi:hypothetical protein